MKNVKVLFKVINDFYEKLSTVIKLIIALPMWVGLFVSLIIGCVFAGISFGFYLIKNVFNLEF